MEATAPTPETRDAVITLQNASVKYRTPTERYGTFKEFAIRWLQGKVRSASFWALRDINLEIYRGEVFGLIGQNGAGKSTLLKLVSRVLPPSEGRVIVRGRVAPLLELGAGFHPELTGRENIFLNGAMLGFSHSEMEEKFKRIVEFSELHEFIEAPLRTYSSGMWARLGFAVAVDAEPNILILDEVLSVGDEAFQRKCLARIEQFRQEKATILLVSHNTAMVEQMCQRAAWLDHGQIRAIGETDMVARAYRESQRNT